MNNNSTTFAQVQRETPSDRIIQHCDAIEKHIKFLQKQLAEERLRAGQGQTIWADVGSIAHVRELTTQIVDFYGEGKSKEIEKA